jgi:hypothetical protein
MTSREKCHGVAECPQDMLSRPSRDLKPQLCKSMFKAGKGAGVEKRGSSDGSFSQSPSHNYWDIANLLEALCPKLLSSIHF